MCGFQIKKFVYFLFVVAMTGFGCSGVLDAGTKDYPDLNTQPLLPSSSLETVATLPEPPGNIAVSSDGRIFFTVHPESHPAGFKLYELKKGVPVPYPDEDSQKNLRAVLGLAIDGRNQLWVIDHGGNGIKKPRALAYELATNKIAHEYEFPRTIGQWGSYFNDLRVSPDGKTVYIADISFFRKNPALVVYDVESGTARRVLENHPSVKAQRWIVKNKLRKMTFFGGLISLRLGVDGIALDRNGEWLYYGAMNHDSVFRVRTSDLRDSSLSSAELAKRVERFGSKPLCDGIEMDASDNLYITDVEHGTIFRLDPRHQLKTLIDSPAIRWPDGMSAASDGFLYVTDSALSEVMLQSRQHIKKSAPFYIYRIKLPSTAAFDKN